MTPVEFMEGCHGIIWSQRPRDIPYRDTITMQRAICEFINQTGISREELADRLLLNYAKLAYAETTGKLNESQLETMITLAKDYSLPNFAQYFDSALHVFKANRRVRNLKK